MTQAQAQTQQVDSWTLDRVLRAGVGIGLAGAVIAVAVATNFALPVALTAAVVALALAWVSAAAAVELARAVGAVRLWGGNWWARVLSWLVIPALLFVIYSARDRVLFELLSIVAAAVGTWALLAAVGYLSAALLTVAVVAASAHVALLVMVERGLWPTLANAAAWAVAALSAIWLGRRRYTLRRKMLWVAAGLTGGPEEFWREVDVTQGREGTPGNYSSTRDTRPAPRVIQPSWRADDGLPITWIYPPTLTPNAALHADLERVLSERVGARVTVTMERYRAQISATPQAEIREESVVDVESALAPLLPGVTITELVRDAAGQAEAVTFTWPPSVTNRASSGVIQERLGATLRDALGRPFTLSLDRTARVGRAEPIAPLPDIVPHPPRDPAEPMKVKFGIFRSGEPCVWDLDAPLPHLLINGGTGGGKTVLLLSILLSLPENAIIRGIDPKRLGLFNLALIPGARAAATREVGMVDTLLEIKKLMDDRYEYLERNGPHLRKTLAPIVLVMDEGESMVQLLNSWWKTGGGKEDWKERFDLEKMPTGTEHPIISDFTYILQLGREARVHVVLASQQASANWIPTAARGQFAVRIALQNLEASSSVMLFGTPIARSGLEPIPGRAWVGIGIGTVPEHAQIYWTPKLEPGLNDADRAILHGLGITLPDDEGFSHSEIAAFNMDAETETFVEGGLPPERAPSAAVAPPEAQPESVSAPAAPVASESVVEAESDGDEPETYPLSVLEVTEGMRVLVDEDGVQLQVTVELVGPDPVDPEYIAVDYLADDGSAGTLSVRDDETVQMIVAAGAPV